MQHILRSTPLCRGDDHGSKLVHHSHALRVYVRPAMASGKADRDAATFTFYIQTWDEYYTQTLTLGIVSGPVEGILTLCIVYAITGYIGGGSYWQKSAIEAIGIERSAAIPDLIYSLSWNEWWIVYGGVVLVGNTLSRSAPLDWCREVDADSCIASKTFYPSDVSASSLLMSHFMVYYRVSSSGSLYQSTYIYSL